jgi:hypothetical protein
MNKLRQEGTKPSLTLLLLTPAVETPTSDPTPMRPLPPSLVRF